METKKTAMQKLIEWGDKKLKKEPMKQLSFAEVIDKAEKLLKLEKKQLIEADNRGFLRGLETGRGRDIKGSGDWYDQVYK